MRRTQPITCLAIAALLLSACGAEDDDVPEDEATVTETATVSPAQEEGAGEEEQTDSEPFASAEVVDVAGNPIGDVTVTETDEGIRLSAEVQNLNPGFRAIAIHENGVCEAPSTDEWGQTGDFFSAGEVLMGTLEDDPGVVEGEDELAETPEAEDTEGEDPDEDAAPEDGPQEDPNAAGSAVQTVGQVWSEEVPPAAQEEEVETPRSERAGALPNLLVNEDGSGMVEVVSARLSQEMLLEDGGTAVIVSTQADHHGNIPERYAPYGPDAGSQATGDTGQRYACGVLEAEE